MAPSSGCSMLWRCVPFKHSMQCVAPTLNSTVFGSSPGGQKLHVTPSELYRPGGHTSHSEFVGSDARPATHSTHSRPVALAQLWLTWSNSFGSLHLRHSVEVDDGAEPGTHRSHTPSTPA